MNKYLKSAFAALIVGAIFAGLFQIWQKNSLPKEGMRKLEKMDQMESEGLPHFEGKDLAGKPFKLTEVKDQVVIVNFWATWCGPCVEEVPSLISLVEALNGKVRLVAVSADNSRDDIVAFLKAFPKFKNPNITILYDEDRSISRIYGVDRFPESFVANRNLKLVKKIIGGISWYNKDSEAFMNELYSK